MEIIFSVAILLAVPAIIKKYEYLQFIKIFSPVALCYFMGFVITQLPFPFHHSTIESVSHISIALSISLLVLNSKFSRFREILAPALKAFFLGILSLVIALFITFFATANIQDYGAEILGMLTGVYVGGTPNLNAIGLALEVPNDTIVLVNTAEIFYGGIYFLLLITLIKPFLSLFLRKYQTHSQLKYDDEKGEKFTTPEKIKYSGMGIFFSILTLAVSFGVSWILFNEANIAALLLTLTTVSVLMAQNGYIKKLPLKFETADFLLLVFSFGIGLQVDFSELFARGIEIYLLCGMVFFLTIGIHFFLAWLTRTDTDTLIISSTAALYGPAFIAPVAKSIRNKELIFYGITLGLLGYILGNYLGIGLAYLFMWLR